MDLPVGYVEALCDELAPYGFDLRTVLQDDDGTVITFRTDADSFERQHPDLGIAESYGSGWPPEELTLRVCLAGSGDPIQIDFETIDLLAQTASSDRALRDRLNTLADPSDHAMAVGEALGLALSPQPEPSDYFD